MQVVEALQVARALDRFGRLSYELQPLRQYALLDHEAAAGARDGAVRILGRLEEILPLYRGESLTSRRLLVPFTGGQGDALQLLSCLVELIRQEPTATIVVSCPPLHHDLLNTLLEHLQQAAEFFPRGVDPSRTVQIQSYPPPASELKNYAYFASLEYIQQFGHDPNYLRHEQGLSNLEVFARCLHTPLPPTALHWQLPSELLTAWNIGTARQPRVGLALSRAGHMRNYPIDLALTLVQELVQQQIAVVLLGRAAEVGRPLPHAPPWVINLLDRLPDSLALAAVISQLDALICPDSFFMHLGGVLRVPTVALFTASPAGVAGGYPTVLPLYSHASCSPCGAARDRCPAGHNHCVVHHSADLQPARIVQHLTRLITACTGTGNQ
ncbi:MAG: hypothetical protein HJJLKODD_01158 [Phycisphaerae bacterium]|nr:hypothetical protein [Phycisphaerae bacterium]